MTRIHPRSLERVSLSAGVVEFAKTTPSDLENIIDNYLTAFRGNAPAGTKFRALYANSKTV